VTGGFFSLRRTVAAILALLGAWGFLRGPSAPLGVTPVPSARSLRVVAFSPGSPANAARISHLSRPANMLNIRTAQAELGVVRHLRFAGNSIGLQII
jgi:hypothetical protein